MRSIFSKVLLSYLLVILLTMTVSYFLMSLLIRHYLVESKRNEILTDSQEIALLVTPMFQRRVPPNFFEQILPNITRLTNAQLWLFNRDGQEIFAPEDGNVIQRPLTAAEWQTVANGQAVAFAQTWHSSQPFIAAAAPVKTRDGAIAGVVYLVTPLTGVTRAFSQVLFLLAWSSLSGLLVAMLCSYILTRTISRPIVAMTEATRRMQDSDFDIHVPVTSKDEIGYLAQAINHLAVRLDQLENMRREFVANVSHELRTPLTAIQGYTEAMIDGLADETSRHKYLSIIRQETLRLTRLVNDLLSLSRLQAHQIELHATTVPIPDLVNRIIDKLYPLAQGKQIALSYHYTTPNDAAYADSDRLEQILTNLVDNAIRYSPNQTQIVISSAPENNQMRIAVQDQGPGIPESDLPHIWNRFHRVQKARNRSDGGSGLGLAIAKELVSAMNGQVGVDSIVGQGSCFYVLLPVVQRSTS